MTASPIPNDIVKHAEQCTELQRRKCFVKASIDESSVGEAFNSSTTVAFEFLKQNVD